MGKLFGNTNTSNFLFKNITFFRVESANNKENCVTEAICLFKKNIVPAWEDE